MSKSNDEKIKKLKQLVAAKKESLGGRPKLTLNTNGLFKWSDGRSTNLNVCSKKQQVLYMASEVMAAMHNRGKAAEFLGIEDSFLYNGFKFSDWLKDLQSIMTLLSWKEEEEKLQVLSKKLDKLISDEARTEMELEEISKLL